MITKLTRRAVLTIGVAMGATVAITSGSWAADKILLRMATSGSETDQRSVAMLEVFAPMVEDFIEFQPSYNSTIFAQGTELDAISRGNWKCRSPLRRSWHSSFRILDLCHSYVHQDAAHQVAVFNDSLMDPFKATTENDLGVKLLSVMYLGRRQVNLRHSKDELTVMTPADLADVNLRMPGTDAWQFLGKALGAAPTPMAFGEVYTALSTGAVDGQDNPLPTVVDAKFYEVTKQIILTSHLVDLNYIAISKEFWTIFPLNSRPPCRRRQMRQQKAVARSSLNSRTAWFHSLKNRDWMSTNPILMRSAVMSRTSILDRNSPLHGRTGSEAINALAADPGN